MLTITIPGKEQWDESIGQFVTTLEQTLQLEHSLVSLKKWESKWHKSFLTGKEKTNEEVIDYVKCMTITQNVDPNVYYNLTAENMEEINNYISNPMSATYIPEDNSKKPSKESVTAELIYYWMIESGIPFECQKWHLNSLLTLIRTCSFKRQPPKKRSRKDIMAQNAAINAARRKQLNSKG